MAILLSWKNNNPASNTLRIYRTETTFDMANLPAPIATLAGNTQSYTDETVQGAKSYTYLIQVSNGSEVVYTKSPTVVNIKNRGPGPQMLQQGDYDCGYFGEVSADELPNVFTAFGVNSSFVGVADRYPLVYHKFAWKGRILYYGAEPLYTTQIGNTTSKRKYARSGLKFNFSNAETKATVLNIVNKNNYSFHARCPRSTPENWDGTTSFSNLANLQNPDTEFNQILGALTRLAPPGKRKLSGIKTTVPQSGFSNYGIAVADIEVTADSSAGLARMYGAGSSIKMLPSAVSGAVDLNQYQTFTGHAGWYMTSSSGNQVIWPVFELIEN